MTDTEQTTLDLPGLTPEPPGSPTASSALVKAVEQTIRALFADDRIGEVDAGRVALAMELAHVIALKRTSKRASTVGFDAKVLMEILDGFREDAKGEGDVLRDAMVEWSARVEAAGLNPPPAPLAAVPDLDESSA